MADQEWTALHSKAREFAEKHNLTITKLVEMMGLNEYRDSVRVMLAPSGRDRPASTKKGSIGLRLREAILTLSDVGCDINQNDEDLLVDAFEQCLVVDRKLPKNLFAAWISVKPSTLMGKEYNRSLIISVKKAAGEPVPLQIPEGVDMIAKKDTDGKDIDVNQLLDQETVEFVRSWLSKLVGSGKGNSALVVEMAGLLRVSGGQILKTTRAHGPPELGPLAMCLYSPLAGTMVGFTAAHCLPDAEEDMAVQIHHGLQVATFVAPPEIARPLVRHDVGFVTPDYNSVALSIFTVGDEHVFFPMCVADVRGIMESLSTGQSVVKFGIRTGCTFGTITGFLTEGVDMGDPSMDCDEIVADISATHGDSGSLVVTRHCSVFPSECVAIGVISRMVRDRVHIVPINRIWEGLLAIDG